MHFFCKGSGAAIATAMGIVGLGTDTDGSIIAPAAFNSLYSLRPPQNEPPTDGVIPLFPKQDTVGPMTKYIDDLVLSYSIMVDKQTIYESYLQDMEPKMLSFGYFTNFLNTFSVNTDPQISYIVHSEIKAMVDLTVERLKHMNVQVFEHSLNTTEIERIFQIILAVYDAMYKCIRQCQKYELNAYFNDSSRFSYDSPYKNFESLVTSPLLDIKWKYRFDIINSTNQENECVEIYSKYDENRKEFLNIIDNWFEMNITALLIPSTTILPYFDNQNFTGIISLRNFAAFSGYAALNIPIGFTKPLNESPDGLPVGVLLISKSKDLINAFKIAKLYETNYGIFKLPNTTPLIAKPKCNHEQELNAFSKFIQKFIKFFVNIF